MEYTKEQHEDIQGRIKKVQDIMAENEIALVSRIEKVSINEPKENEPLLFADIIVTKWVDLKYAKESNNKTKESSESGSGEPA